jgi:succinate dehydrogenase (ubiquinone) flavoprotein subunit
MLSNGGGKVLEEAGAESFRDLERFRNTNGTRLTVDLRIEIQKATQTDVAVFGNEDSLCTGLERLRSVENAFNNDVCVKDKSSDLELRSRGDIGNQKPPDVHCAVQRAQSGLERKESRGSHAREDYQERDDVNFMRHSLGW